MTPAPRDNLSNRLMDIVFGKRSTQEEMAFAESAAPSKPIRRTFIILTSLSFAILLPVLLASHGWLPFAPTIDRDWFWGVFLVNIAARFADERVQKHYKRKARAALTPAS